MKSRHETGAGGAWWREPVKTPKASVITAGVQEAQEIIKIAVFTEKIPGRGEDAQPLIVDIDYERPGSCIDLMTLQLVADGAGGAGAQEYIDSYGESRTGACLASNLAIEVSRHFCEENRHIAALCAGTSTALDHPANPDELMAQGLQFELQRAFQERLRRLNGHGGSSLKSRMLKPLPTTLTGCIVKETGAKEIGLWVFWAGDSRCYILDNSGLRQLSSDDIAGEFDAFENIYRDAQLSNCISADPSNGFQINYRRHRASGPLIVLCATDGCFQYFESPMHFEHMVLESLMLADNSTGFQELIAARLHAVTGDDATLTMTMHGFNGIDNARDFFRPRYLELGHKYISVMDDYGRRLRDLENQLASVRALKEDALAALWRDYKRLYERELTIKGL